MENNNNSNNDNNNNNNNNNNDNNNNTKGWRKKTKRLAEIKVNKRFYILHNQTEVRTPQNGQTPSNNLLARADELFDCV